jgi:hypothetical protein
VSSIHKDFKKFSMCLLIRTICSYLVPCKFAITSHYHLGGIFKKFPHFHMSEENGKSGRGGDIVGCHVNSRQCKPVHLAVSVRVAMKR